MPVDTTRAMEQTRRVGGSAARAAGERGPYLALTGLFLSLFAAFSTGRFREFGGVRPFDFVLLSLATFRLGRMIAYDRVLQPLREPFTETVPDQSGAGETVEPEGEGAQRAIGELMSCPICAGTWVSAGLVYALHLFPGPTRVFIAVMGAIGAGELLGAATEAFSWSASAARKEAGR